MTNDNELENLISEIKKTRTGGRLFDDVIDSVGFDTLSTHLIAKSKSLNNSKYRNTAIITREEASTLITEAYIKCRERANKGGLNHLTPMEAKNYFYRASTNHLINYLKVRNKKVLETSLDDSEVVTQLSVTQIEEESRNIDEFWLDIHAKAAWGDVCPTTWGAYKCILDGDSYRDAAARVEWNPTTLHYRITKLKKELRKLW